MEKVGKLPPDARFRIYRRIVLVPRIGIRIADRLFLVLTSR